MNIGEEDPREVEFEDPTSVPAPVEPATAPVTVPVEEPVGV